ncbi:transferase family-domain-containing protein [Crepidotus variabilis]|uniref:Transferase family-domain-containing protein n=1 Tax=Crepidotus variabilis TaxID=179855 RepID=A0A9P6EN16_9AGAR|nr:transferase family-domain-containing protein [Crepidotus variabilis]
MKETNEYEMDLQGQQSSLQIYTQLCLCYPIKILTAHTAIVDILNNGLERLSAGFPWLAGQVVNEGASAHSTGIFKIKSLERTPRLVVKDLRNDPAAPTMESLRQAKFPFKMLDESIVAPHRTLPDSSTSDSPVFLVQATFIIGGLLLTFVGQHATMDITGQGQIIRLFSTACRKEPFTPEELSIGNLPRRTIIPLLDDSYKPGLEVDHQIVKPPFPAPPSTEPLPTSTWAYFIFTHTSLAALKSLATETLTSGFISTDDALTAFIWQSILRARLPRLSPTIDVTLARAIDPRRYLNIPQTYPGVVQNMTYHTYPLRKLVDEPLGSIAAELRSVLDFKTSKIGFNTSALATLIDRTSNKTTINVTASLDLSKDIMLSSWAKVECRDLDFSLGLGKPECVRRPRFDPVESLLYLTPKAGDDEIAAGLCLRDEDMQRLKVDKEFVKYGTYIG